MRANGGKLCTGSEWGGTISFYLIATLVYTLDFHGNAS